MNIANVDQNILHRIDRIRQIVIDLDENIEGKYQGYYPSIDPEEVILQNLDEDGLGNVNREEYKINRLKYDDTFIKDVHNLLDVYNLCSSSFSQQIDKLGIKQISMFIKQLILSHRKSMILALRVVCSFYKVPQVIDERKFKIPTYEVEQEVIKEANAKKYNYKKVKIQRGTVDKDLVYLIKNDLFDKPDLVPENIKVKLGQIYDPLLKEYREAQEIMNETLQNKSKYLSMQPSRCEDYMNVTIKDLQGTTSEFYEYESNTQKSNQSREEINQLSNKFYSDMIMEELSKEIKENFEDSARKRMQSVILQVISFLRRKNGEQQPSIQCQTDVTMEQFDKQIQEAEKEARASRWEVEAIKGNIRTLSLKNEDLLKDLEVRNKKIQELNLQIIDQIQQLEKLKNEMAQLEIQYDLKLQKKITEFEQKQKNLEAELQNKKKEQVVVQQVAQKKKMATSFTQTGKFTSEDRENNHIYASQKHYSLSKRRLSHDLQLEGRVDYFYKLKKIKEELDRNPKKRKRLNIPQEVTLRTENRALSKMQKQLQVLQQIKEQEQEILNLRQQQQTQQGQTQPLSPLLPHLSSPNRNSKLKSTQAKEDIQIRGTSSKLISQHQLDYIYQQYSNTKILIQSESQNKQIQTENTQSRKQTGDNTSARKIKTDSSVENKLKASVNLPLKNIDKNNNQQLQQENNPQNLYKYIEELKKSQHDLFKDFTTDQVNEIEEFILQKELGYNNGQQINKNGSQFIVDQNGQLQSQSPQEIQLVFDEYHKLKPYQELILQLQQIQNEGERVYIVGILHNYICKLQRRRRQLSKRSQVGEQFNYKLSPDSFSLSPQQTRKFTSKERMNSEMIYEEESEKKDGFQSYKHFHDKLKNHQLNQQIQKNRQRSCYSLNTIPNTNINLKNLNDPIVKTDYEKFLRDQFHSEFNDSPPKQKTPRDYLNKTIQQISSDQKDQGSDKKMKVRIRRQNSLDRCESLNLPALNIIMKAQEHLLQFEQSVTLQNYKKIHNRILTHKKYKQNEDIAKMKSLQQNKSNLSLVPLDEDQNQGEYTDEVIQQTFQLLSQNHELMLECVQIFQNSNQGQLNSFTSEQAKQLLKQSKYPFQSIQQIRNNGINNLDVTFIIWKNQFSQLPAQLKSYIVKKVKQIKKIKKLD